jgi:hypothetical protein
MTEEKIRITAINKIKILNDKTAVINYVQSGDLSSSEVIFTGKEKVTNEFFNKFQENISGFIGCMPKLSEDAKNITMNAIKFDYGKDNGALQNVLYSVKYAFNPANNAVVNISTPLLPLYKEGMSEKTFYVSESHEALLKEVIELAKAYINGDTGTKQQNLNLEVTEDEEG